MEKNDNNMQIFIAELSNLVGKRITLKNIHASEGRYYYIQQTKIGAPIIFHHYKGAFFVDIHKNDLAGIKSGKIDAIEYIRTANWQIGYFWGGGSMIGGGFYQPFDIVGRSEEVKRYFQILSCRGNKRNSGYQLTEEICNNCFVSECPFSQYKIGNWENEIQENDPREYFFEALKKRFETEYEGYTLKGFLCSFYCNSMPEDEIWIKPNEHSADEQKSFGAYASAETIRSLLMHEIEPKDWDEYVTRFKFMHTGFSYDIHPPVTMEKIKEIFDESDD